MIPPLSYATGCARPRNTLPAPPATPLLSCDRSRRDRQGRGRRGVHRGLPDGTGIAIKIEDGGARARPAAIYGTLVALGLPADQLQPVIADDRVLGGGEPAGQLRSVVRLVRDRPA